MLGGGLGGGGLFGQNTPQGGLGGGAAFGGLGRGTGLGGGLGGTSTAGGLFGNKPVGTGGGLFGTTGGALGGGGGGGLFGQTPQSQAGGTGLFGTTGGGLGAGTTGGLFQSPQAGFGQQKTGLGGLFGQSPALGGGTAGGGGLFSQQQSTPLFKQQASTATGLGTGGIFGGGLGATVGGTAVQGTPVKFQPAKGTDTVIKNGITQNVQTNLQCATAMAAYENKSLEELRYEDYATGRKGPTGSALGGGGLFQTGQGVGLGGTLGGGTAGGLFGQQQNKALGGGLGGGLFGTQQQQQQQQLGGGGLFGQQQKTGGGLYNAGQNKGLGLGGLGFNVQQTSQMGGLFGGGQAVGGGLFSQANTGQQTGLGGLGQTQLGGGGGIFGGKTQLGGLGSLSAPSAGLGGGLGGGGLSGIGRPGGLGQQTANLGGGLGGGLFNKNQLGGGLQTGGLGTGLGGLGQTGQLGALGLGGGLGTGGLGLGQTKLGGGGGLGMTGGLGGNVLGGGLGTQLGGLGQNANLGQSPLQSLTAQAQQQQLQQQLEILANSPFGDSPLFRSAISDVAKSKKKESTVAPVATKTAATPTPHYRLNTRPVAKFKPISLSSPSRHRDKSQLFEGLEGHPVGSGPGSVAGGGGGGGGETFVPRKNIKKLTFRPKPSEPMPLPDSTSPLQHTSHDSLPPPTERVPVPVLGDAIQPTSTPQKAFPVTPVPTPAHDDSVESPELTLGGTYTNLLKKPIPLRPPPPDLDESVTGLNGGTVSTTSGTLSASFTKSGVGSPAKSSEGSPPKLIREPLRAHLAEEDVPPFRPSGLVLSHPDYYTIPSLDEIDGLVVEGEEGSMCMVEGFTVGRRGFGQVHFPGKTDVYGFNLDELVSIGHKEVVVYPEDRGKPPEGEGLNKRAVVTLEGSWPLCKTTREPIKDPDRLARISYVEKLKRATAKIGAIFHDYDPETGSCTFEVSHFSKYKLADDSEEEEGEEGEGGAGKEGVVKKLKTAQVPRRLQSEQRGKNLVQLPQTSSLTAPAAQQLGSQTSLSSGPLRLDDDDEEMSDEERYEVAAESVPMETPLPLAPPSHQFASAMGLNTHRMQVMKASFFSSSSTEGGVPTTSATRPTGRGRPTVSARPFPSQPSRPQFSTAIPSPPSSLLRRDLLSSNPLQASLNHSFSAANRSVTTEDRTEPVSNIPRLDTVLPPSLGPLPPFLPTQPALNSLQAQSSLVSSRHDLLSLVPLRRSLERGKQRLVADMGLFLGRSFRVGWGPNWTLAHSGSRTGSGSTPSSGIGPPLFTALSGVATETGSHTNQPLKVLVEKLHVSRFTETEIIEESNSVALYEPYLEPHLEHTDVQLQEGGVPHCVPKRGNALLHAFADVARQHASAFGKGGEVLTQQQMKLVWQLVVALWGNLRSSDAELDRGSYDHHLARRRALSRWLMEASSKTIEREIASAGSSESAYLSSLFSLVTGLQLSPACQLAHKHGDHRLTFLLSQAANSTMTTRILVRQQLSEWEGLKAHHRIAPERLRLYVLLGGLMVWEYRRDVQGREETASGQVNVCEGLDWKRSLALHLWYACQPSATIREVVGEFMQAFQGEGPYAPPPLPPYLESLPSPPAARDDGVEVFDTCYHLLQLYCSRDHSLELTLGPSASTPFQLDYRLSWHLWGILHALEYTHMHPTKQAQLHTSFASQLESAGLWKWAVFVLLHLDDPKLRRRAVQDLLSRRCSEKEEPIPEEDFVTKKLSVPVEWVYQAKALRAQYLELYDVQALHLLRAGLWNEAHTVIIDHLVPDSIISGDTRTLLSMLEQLSDPSRCALIQGWEYAGSVYLDFLHISNNLQKLAESEDVASYEVEQLSAGLTTLAHRIEHVPCRSPKERLCQSELGKRTATYTKLVASLRTQPTREVSHALGYLPMPSDYALSEYHQVLQSHISELAV